MLSAAKKTQIYDFIKVAVEILVVLQHITVMYSDHAAVPQITSSRLLASVYAVLAVATMPIFMCICGAVYDYCISIGKYQNRLRFIGNKFKRLMIPYYVFSALIVAPVVIKVGVVSWSYHEFLVRGTLLGGLTRHLWFCMSLFCIFILCALLRDVTEKCTPFIILPIAAVMSYIGMRWSAPYFQLHQTLHYILYFYAGTLINSHWDKFAGFIRKHLVMCLILSAAAWLSILASAHLRYLAAFGSILFIFAVSMPIGIPCLEGHASYALLKKDSFGIYLLHPMMIYLIFYAFRDSTVNPYLISIVTFAAVYSVSIVVTEIIRRMNLGIIIGEKSLKSSRQAAKMLDNSGLK